MEEHEESVLIRKALEPVGGHANTPVPIETEFSVAQLVIDEQPPHDPAVPAARENWTGCPCARVPTMANAALAVADNDRTVTPAEPDPKLEFFMMVQ